MKSAELDRSKWTAKELADLAAKGHRHRRADELPCTSVVRPADYAHDLKRGSLEYMPDWFNYSLHNVTIPDGTTVRESNFTQWHPGTDAISGKGLTFEDCNLTNCLVDPSWTLIRCNTAQAWLVTVDDGRGGTREKREYICDHPEKLKDVKPKEPANAVKARVF